MPRRPEIRGTYVVVMDAQAIAAAEDLLELTAGDYPIRIRSIVATQEAQDSSETLPFQLYSATAAGSGGSAVTPTVITPGAKTVDFTAARNNDTQATEDAIYDRRGVDMLLGYHFLPLEAEMPIVAAGTIIVVGMMGTPAASMTMSCTMLVDELFAVV